MQRGLHTRWSQPAPVQPSSQRHAPPMHTPWVPQSTEHTSAGGEKVWVTDIFVDSDDDVLCRFAFRCLSHVRSNTMEMLSSKRRFGALQVNGHLDEFSLDVWVAYLPFQQHQNVDTFQPNYMLIYNH